MHVNFQLDSFKVLNKLFFFLNFESLFIKEIPFLTDVYDITSTIHAKFQPNPSSDLGWELIDHYVSQSDAFGVHIVI